MFFARWFVCYVYAQIYFASHASLRILLWIISYFDDMIFSLFNIFKTWHFSVWNSILLSTSHSWRVVKIALEHSSIINILRYSILSSVKKRNLVPVEFFSVMLFMYSRNRRGPTTLPWDTPDKLELSQKWSFHNNSLLAICQEIYNPYQERYPGFHNCTASLPRCDVAFFEGLAEVY